MKTSRNEEGAVLLTTLLVMSLMAVVAVSIIDDVRFAVKRTANVQSYAQADWYVLGAEDFAQSYLETQVISANPQQLNAVLISDKPLLFEIDGGAIGLSVRDGGQCLSLGGLTSSPGRRVFRQLLTNLGWGVSEAARFTSVAIDWQDADTQTLAGGAEDYTYLGRVPAYRTSNTTFTSLTELRALDGVTEKDYQTFRPYMCARPSTAPLKINVNTLTIERAPLLAAFLGGDRALSVATQVLAERPEGGFVDIEALKATPAMQDYSLKDATIDGLSFEPNFVWIEAEISYREATRRAAFEFEISEGKVSRIYRGSGDDAFRPRFESKPS